MPTVAPVTAPVVEFTVAAVVLLLQLPPVTASVYITVAPTHTPGGPMMAVGVGLTDIVSVTVQKPAIV